MGILKRFSDIMSANINALLDKAEDPEKMIDQYLRQMKADYLEVKNETAVVLAQEKTAFRKVDECNDKIASMVAYAKKAIQENNDSDAKTFLNKKAFLQTKLEQLEKERDLASSNAKKMRQMHDKLFDDITKLEEKREVLKSKLKVAKTQERMADFTSKFSDSVSLETFEQLEDKIDQQVAKAEAMAELGAGDEEDLDALMDKYDDDNEDEKVEDELAALKAEMGL